ncbi:ribbon-helix-helix protein, CopG family [Sphingomonas sp. PB4P5]|uniref:ribbon-helix-helix protein, CopG family n=1 Tax=Parasphingomonas puruogangriensis TaxID=3096155 RepID=UPI002FCA55A6
MRTLVDLPDDDVAWLDAAARAGGKSRTAIVREAIAAFRHAEDKTEMEQYFGLWERHGSRVDGLAYEQELRDEWPSVGTPAGATRSDAA